MATSPDDTSSPRHALVVGSTGIVGGNLADHLLAEGWQVSGLARTPRPKAGMHLVSADLQQPDSLAPALSDLGITHVFFCTWARQPNEAENVRVNGAMIENLFAALAGHPLQHAALVTGTKQYLGPFESHGQSSAETPFREDSPRLPGLNFYYTQEDVLFAAAARSGFTWSVHRPHTIVGFALGNAMNMGVTLAIYASLCRETGQPFVFPGSHLQWNALTDVTDAHLLAEHLAWASTTPAAADQAFNIVNNDVFRWRWLWPQIAAYFSVSPVGPPTPIAPLEPRMTGTPELWKTIAARHHLAEPDIHRLVSWWHTDGDLGREVECVNDMSKSRRLGFPGYADTLSSFHTVFNRLRAEHLIPE